METGEEYSEVDVWLVASGCQVLGRGGGGSRSKLAPHRKLNTLIGDPQFPRWQRGFLNGGANQHEGANRAQSQHTHTHTELMRCPLCVGNTHYLDFSTDFSLSLHTFSFRALTPFVGAGLRSGCSVCPLHTGVVFLSVYYSTSTQREVGVISVSWEFVGMVEEFSCRGVATASEKTPQLDS